MHLRHEVAGAGRAEDTASQGETIEAALDNLREATEVYLEEFPAAKA